VKRTITVIFAIVMSGIALSFIIEPALAGKMNGKLYGNSDGGRQMRSKGAGSHGHYPSK
jgi:hypothetical protein